MEEKKQITMKKKVSSENYLEKTPIRNTLLKWSADKDGIVTLEIENTGIYNRIAQKLFKKPKVSYIHLDLIGSFVWPLIDGEKNIIELGKPVSERFGDDAEPLYERLAKFFQILESYNFIRFK